MRPIKITVKILDKENYEIITTRSNSYDILKKIV